MGELQKESDRDRDERQKYLLFNGAPSPDGWKLPHWIDAPQKSEPSAVERAERDIDALKGANFQSWERQSFEAGLMAAPGTKGQWERLTEWGKLDTMQHWIDWQGVSKQDRASLMLSHLDMEKLSPRLRDQITRDAKGIAPDTPPHPEMDMDK
jgi:hypothetical protein